MLSGKYLQNSLCYRFLIQIGLKGKKAPKYYNPTVAFEGLFLNSVDVKRQKRIFFFFGGRML